MATTTVKRDFHFEHWRCIDALVTARNGVVEIISLGTVESFDIDDKVWRGWAEGTLPLGAFEWLSAECRLRSLWKAAEIEAEIRKANRIPEHRPDCALGGGDFGSINHCTCKGDDEQRRTA